MFQNLNAALQLDWKVVVLGILVLLVVLKDILDLLANWKKKLRIRFGYEDDKDEVDERLRKLERHDKSQYENVNRILDGVDELRRAFIEKAVEDFRFEILEMANGIGGGRKYSKESYVHIIQIHEKYDRLLESIGQTNGQTSAAMEVIMESYKNKLKEGF